MTVLQQRLAELNEAYENLARVFRRSGNVLSVLVRDVLEILKNRTLDRRNMIRIVQKLFEMTVDENLKNLEKKLKKELACKLFNGAIQIERDVFEHAPESLEQSQANELKMPFTPETVVKKQSKFARKPKNFKKLKSVNAKALEKLMDKKGIEVRGLRDILRKSKKGFTDFLRSFGWSDNEIEDAMRTASIQESPKNHPINPTPHVDNSVCREYQIETGFEKNTKTTFTKNIVIKEYKALENQKNKNQSTFFSKQTNCLKAEADTEQTDAKCGVFLYGK